MPTMTTDELKAFLSNPDTMVPEGTFTEVFGKDLTHAQTAFLAAYSICGQVGKAAEASNTNRMFHSIWMKRHESYRKAYEIAKSIQQQMLEDEAVHRATEGLRRYKFNAKGEPLLHPVTGEPYYEDNRSDVLLIFLLKSLDPQKYRENSSLEVTGADGQPIQIRSTVTVCEDADWYGNASKIAQHHIAETAAASDPDSDE